MSKKDKEEIEESNEKPEESIEEVAEEVEEAVEESIEEVAEEVEEAVEESIEEVAEEVEEAEVECPKCTKCGGDTAYVVIIEGYTRFICNDCLTRMPA